MKLYRLLTALRHGYTGIYTVSIKGEQHSGREAPRPPMEAPFAHPVVKKSDQGFKVVLAHRGERLEIGPLNSSKEPEELWPAQKTAARLFCDVLAVKLAVDAGRPLEGLQLRGRQEPLRAAEVPPDVAEGLRSLSLGSLAEMCQESLDDEEDGLRSKDGQDYYRRAAFMAVQKAVARRGSMCLTHLVLQLTPAADKVVVISDGLIGAAERGHLVLLRYLLAAAAAAGGLDRALGKTEWGEWGAVHAAAQAGQLAALQLLVSAVPPEALLFPDEEGQTPLHAAAAAGHAAAVELLLAAAPQAADVEACDGCMALHVAADSGSLETIMLLLAANPKAASAKNGDDATPLFVAARAGDSGAVAALLAAAPGTALMSNYSGQLPLHAAASCQGSPTVAQAVELLLTAAPEAAAALDWQDKTPLHHAAQHRNVAALRLLLKAAPNTAAACDGFNLTPLHLAARGDSLETVRLLLKAAPSTAHAICRGCLPLHFAAEAGRSEAVRLLLPASPSATAANHQGWTALHYAANGCWPDVPQWCWVEVAQAVVEAATAAALSAKTHDGSTPLHLAAARGKVGMVEWLLTAALNQKAAAIATNDLGRMPAHCAAAGGHLLILRRLLQLVPGALQSSTRDGSTLLHCAAESLDVATVRHVLSAVPSLAAKANANGSLPLHGAAVGKFEAVALALLAAAPSTARVATAGGVLPLHYAAQGGCTELVQTLLAAAPDTAMAVGPLGDTPLHMAAAHGHAPVVRVLLEAAPGAAMAANALDSLPLYKAVYVDSAEHTEVVRLLLKAAPAAASHRHGPSRLTAVDIAVQSAALGPLRMLVSAVPQAAAIPSGSGRIPFHSVFLTRCGPWRQVEMARCLLGAGPADDVLRVLHNARPDSLPAFPDFVIARPALTCVQWELFPSPCPGLGRALPAALHNSPTQACHVVRRLPPADVARLRAAALALHRAQARCRVYLPRELNWHRVSLSATP